MFTSFVSHDGSEPGNNPRHADDARLCHGGALRRGKTRNEVNRGGILSRVSNEDFECVTISGIFFGVCFLVLVIPTS